MSRRYASVGLMRRGVRGGSGGARTVQAILGSRAKLLFDARSGISLTSGNVQSWTDQISGVSVSAPAAGNRPAYAADGANFRGLPVLGFTAAGTSQLTNTTAIAALFPSGTPIYISTVLRLTVDGIQRVVSFESAASVSLASAYTNAGNLRPSYYDGSTFNLVHTDVAHVVLGCEFLMTDGTNAIVSVNGDEAATTAHTTGITATASKLSIGTSQEFGGTAEMFLAQTIACTSTPTTAERAELRALQRRDWGY